VTGQPKLVLYPSLQNLVKSAVGHPTKKKYITQLLKTFSCIYDIICMYYII